MYKFIVFLTIIILSAGFQSVFSQGQRTYHYSDGTQQTTGAPKANYSWENKTPEVKYKKEESSRTTTTGSPNEKENVGAVNVMSVEGSKNFGNLDVAVFRNGDAIPEARSNEEWISAGKSGRPAWCYYQNDSANGSKYGKLYNWYAVNDSRGLAPRGYHIPTDKEWFGIIHYYGGENEAGKKMKSVAGWEKNGNGTDANGFSALPAGYRFANDGSFLSRGYYGMFWSSSEKDSKEAWVFFLNLADSKATSVYYDKCSGMSCRYIRD